MLKNTERCDLILFSKKEHNNSITICIRSYLQNSKSADVSKDGDSGSPSSNASLSSPENGVSNKSSGVASKKKSSSTEDSEKSDNGEDSKKKDKKDKKKKKEKKHKKHKKHSKKLKKTKDKQKSSSEEESGDDDVDGKEQGKNRDARNGDTVVLLPNEKIAQSFRKLVESEDANPEDLETKLREKALESMMKANMNR